jgi:hypothetical protein
VGKFINGQSGNRRGWPPGDASDDFPFDEHNDFGGYDPVAEREIMASVWR